MDYIEKIIRRFNMESLIIALLLMILGILVASPGSSEFKINHMDKKLNRIMEHMGIEDISIDEELKELIEDDKKIPAIKRLREETGMGLKEAKKYVDNLDEKSF